MSVSGSTHHRTFLWKFIYHWEYAWIHWSEACTWRKRGAHGAASFVVRKASVLTRKWRIIFFELRLEVLRGVLKSTFEGRPEVWVLWSIVRDFVKMLFSHILLEILCEFLFCQRKLLLIEVASLFFLCWISALQKLFIAFFNFLSGKKLFLKLGFRRMNVLRNNFLFCCWTLFLNKKLLLYLANNLLFRLSLSSWRKDALTIRAHFDVHKSFCLVDSRC